MQTFISKLKRNACLKFAVNISPQFTFVDKTVDVISRSNLAT